MKIHKGDTVQVITGKDRGKTGKVLDIRRPERKLIVEKVHVIKKHKKQTGDQKDPGGIIEMEAPIDLSNVMLVCPSCQETTRVGYKKTDDKKVRVCKKCKQEIH